MCGINGILDCQAIVNRDEIILRMNQAMIHRGPDAGDTYHDEHISLGHRRLSIIGLDESGNQPMKSTDGKVVLVFNGEIYNYKELKSLTPDYQFFSHTDTEVIIALYQSFGFEKMLELIDGMFAIALWDSDKTKLFLARDRFGKKPLYYSIVDDAQGGLQIVFSSEIRGLLASKLFTPKLNKEVLGEYLQIQCVREPNTIVRNVFQIPASNFSVIDINQLGNITVGRLDTKSYWSLNVNQDFAEMGHSSALKIGKELFYQSIEKRMISDVPLGAFLSGGIDSSAIVAGMASLSSIQINTINISFTEQEFSERRFADIVAKKFHTNHQNIVINETSFLDEISEAVGNLDHPTGDGVNSYIVSRATKEAGLTVALNGTGGDEFFAGYSTFSRMFLVRNLQRFGVIELVNLLPSKLKEKILCKDPFSRFLDHRKLNTSIIYSKSISVFNHYNNSLKMVDLGINESLDNSHWISQITDWELECYLKPLLLSDVDNLSMATSLEVRLPFMDHQLATFAFSLPDSIKKTNQPKQFLIDILDGDIPEEVWNRKKMGFTLPWKYWINTVLKDFVEAGLDAIESIESVKPFISRERMKLNKEVNEKWSQVWTLSVLGHWIKNNNIAID